MLTLPFLFPHSAVSQPRSVSKQETYSVMQNKLFLHNDVSESESGRGETLPLWQDCFPETICRPRPGLHMR